MPVPKRDTDQFNLRLPDGMRSSIAERASHNMRSMNSEIVTILASALGNQGDAATGEKFGDRTPAAAQNETALAGGPITHR